MALRRSGDRMRLAGLERAARFAGEAFAYEDLVILPRFAAPLLPIATAALIAAAILVGLTALMLR